MPDGFNPCCSPSIVSSLNPIFADAMGVSHQDPVFVDAMFDSTLFADTIASNPIDKIDDYDILPIEASSGGVQRGSRYH
jgi:hypothetical protein